MGLGKFCFTGKEFLLSTYLLLILAEKTITFKAILAQELLLALPGRHQWFNVADGELYAVHSKKKELVYFTKFNILCIY